MIWKLLGNIRYFWGKCKEDNIGAYAAQSAFFILLSSIPCLMVFSSLLKYTPVTESVIMSIVNRTMPEYIAPFCISIINEVYNKSVGIISVAAVAALWSAAKGVQYLANGLNAVNHLEESRNWLILRFWAIVYTIIFILAIIGMLILLVFGNSLRKLIVQYVPVMIHVTDTILQLRSLIMLAGLILFFMALFKMLPNRKAAFILQLPGALLCALAWYGVSFGLSAYVQYFNGFSMYGSLTTIVLIMLWLYFCMYILMACAEINVVFEGAFKRRLAKRRKRKEKG